MYAGLSNLPICSKACRTAVHRARHLLRWKLRRKGHGDQQPVEKIAKGVFQGEVHAVKDRKGLTMGCSNQVEVRALDLLARKYAKLLAPPRRDFKGQLTRGDQAGWERQLVRKLNAGAGAVERKGCELVSWWNHTFVAAGRPAEYHKSEEKVRPGFFTSQRKGIASALDKAGVR